MKRIEIMTSYITTSHRITIELDGLHADESQTVREYADYLTRDLSQSVKFATARDSVTIVFTNVNPHTILDVRDSLNLLTRGLLSDSHLTLSSSVR
jgi:hypothetical protein